jgi:hypothetical protein
MRIAVITALVLIATLAPLSAQTSGTVEPTAGTWKSFVISSRFELRAPPPPDAAASAKEIGQLKEIAKQRDPAALDLIAYWDTGAPSYRWNEIAVSEALRSNLPVNFASRVLALLHVAMHTPLSQPGTASMPIIAGIRARWTPLYRLFYPILAAHPTRLSTRLPQALLPQSCHTCSLIARHSLQNMPKRRRGHGCSPASAIQAMSPPVLKSVIASSPTSSSGARQMDRMPSGPVAYRWGLASGRGRTRSSRWPRPGSHGFWHRPANSVQRLRRLMIAPNARPKSLNSRPTDVPLRPMPTHSSGSMRWAVSAITNTGTRMSAVCTSNIGSTQILPERHVLTPSRAWRSMTPQ